MKKKYIIGLIFSSLLLTACPAKDKDMNPQHVEQFNKITGQEKTEKKYKSKNSEGHIEVDKDGNEIANSYAPHSWTRLPEGIIEQKDVEPTCLTGGVKYYICSVCGEIDQDDISPLGHSYVTHESVSATMESDGNERYYTCSRCDMVFDKYKEPNAEPEFYKIPKYGTDLSLVYDGKVVSTASRQESNGKAFWSFPNIELEYQKDIYLRTVGENFQVVQYTHGLGITRFHNTYVEGTYNLKLEQTDSGYVLSVLGAREPGITITINEQRYLMEQTMFYDNYQSTYVFGAYSFNKGDKILIEDEILATTRGYGNLDKGCQANLRDYKKGTNNEIIIEKSDRYIIEYKRNNDKYISITKVSDPVQEGDFDVQLIDKNTSLPLLSMEYEFTTDAYKEETWLINNSKISNVDDVKAAIANKLTVYGNTVELAKDEKFKIANVTDENDIKYVSLDTLVPEGDRSNVIQAGQNEENYFIAKQTGTYLISYIPAYNRLFVSPSPDMSAIYKYSDTGAVLEIQSEFPKSTKITISSKDYQANGCAYFYVKSLAGNFYLNYKLDSSIDPSIARIVKTVEGNKIVFFNAGTYEVTLDLTTYTVTLVYTLAQSK